MNSVYSNKFHISLQNVLIFDLQEFVLQVIEAISVIMLIPMCQMEATNPLKVLTILETLRIIRVPSTRSRKQMD